MQLDSPPLVVSPLWVESSIKADRRQVEKKYAVIKPPPQPTAIAIHPADAPPKRKQRATTAAARAAQPKPSAAYDVDTSDIMFSSSQLIRGGGAAGKCTRSTRNNGVVDPDEVNSIKKVAKNNNNNNNNGKRRRAAAAAAAAHEDDSQQRSLPALPGRNTQQVADILCIDLPVGDDRDVDSGDDDGLDTPLSVRVAKKKKEEVVEEKDGDVEMEEEEEPQPKKKETARAAPASNNNRKQKKPKPPLAMRFSVRQLRVYPERPVLLHKGTPLPGCEPPKTVIKAKAAKKGGSGIPIPPIEMVSSPWADAEQLPLTQDTPQPSTYQRYQQQQQTAPPSTQPAPTFLEGKKPTPFTAPRPWDNGPVCPLGTTLGGGGGGRRRAVRVKSRYGQEAERQQQHNNNNNNNNNNKQQENMDPSPVHIPPPGPGTAVKKTPVGTAGTQVEQQQPVVTEVVTAANTGGGNINSNSGGGGGGARRTVGESSISVSRRATVSTRSNSDGSPLLARQLNTTPRTIGVVAMTSVDQPLNDICASACRRLRGMRLCPDGKEDGQITHLVVGQERRTLKVMLAIANGAWLISPEWITASLEAGRWLPESQFPAEVRFAAAADKARAALEVPDDNLLLEGRRLHITAGGTGKAASVNANALRRVALALGAKVVAAAKSCTMAVVMGTSRRPEGLGRDVPAVREEWLLQAAERYELPCINTFKL